MPVPRKPSREENHSTVTESPSGSTAMDVKLMVDPKRPPEKLAWWFDRWTGAVIKADGG